MDYQDLTPEQKDAVDKWHQEHSDHDFDCQDNHRYAVQGNSEQEEEYYDRDMRGCCGRLDVLLPLPDGSVLMYGFNYGH